MTALVLVWWVGALTSPAGEEGLGAWGLKLESKVPLKAGNLWGRGGAHELKVESKVPLKAENL